MMKLSLPTGNPQNFACKDKRTVNTNPIPFWEPQWETIDGVDVMRIKGSKYVAVPANGVKRSKHWEIINIDSREYVTQLLSNEYRQWLIQSAKNENIEPTGHI